MVLVSKLTGSSSLKDQSSGGSFFNKMRCSLVRSASGASLRRHLPGSKSGTLTCVETFENSAADDFDDDEAEQQRKRPLANMVVLSDLEAVERCIIHVERRLSQPVCSDDSAAEIIAGEAAFSSSTFFETGPQSLRNDSAALLDADQPDASSQAVPPKENELQQGLPSPSWDPSSPPAQACPAWHLTRESNTDDPCAKFRFPARLPPLSGLRCTALWQSADSNAVTEISKFAPTVSPSGESFKLAHSKNVSP